MTKGIEECRGRRVGLISGLLPRNLGGGRLVTPRAGDGKRVS